DQIVSGDNAEMTRDAHRPARAASSCGLRPRAELGAWCKLLDRETGPAWPGWPTQWLLLSLLRIWAYLVCVDPPGPLSARRRSPAAAPDRPRGVRLVVGEAELLKGR